MRLLLVILISGIVSLMFSNNAAAQITSEIVSPIDAQFADYLTAGISQDGNIYPSATYTTTSGNAYTTAVAGDGFYPDNNMRVGWMHAQNTPEFLEDSLNYPPAQFVNRFDLNAIPNVQSYQDSLEAFFVAYGIPTTIRQNSKDEITPKIYPIPAENHFYISGLKKGVFYRLEIYNMTGQLIGLRQGLAMSGEMANPYDISGFKSGIFLIHFTLENKKKTKETLKLLVK